MQKIIYENQWLMKNPYYKNNLNFTLQVFRFVNRQNLKYNEEFNHLRTLHEMFLRLVFTVVLTKVG